MGWDQANRAASLAALGRYDEAAAALDEARAIAAGTRRAIQVATGPRRGGRRADRAQPGRPRASHGREPRRRCRWPTPTSRTPHSRPGRRSRSPRRVPARRTGRHARRRCRRRGKGDRNSRGSCRRRCWRRPRCAWPAATAGARSADAQAAQRLFAAAGQLESEWRAWLVSALGRAERGRCLRGPRLRHRAESGVARLSRRAGASTTTAGTHGGPISRDVLRSSRTCSSEHGRSTQRRRTEDGKSKQGDPGGGQGGGGKKKPAKKTTKKK